ncbi:MAG: ABC transporter substrate-binding protein [Hyphomicrobiaceae bacterium]
MLRRREFIGLIGVAFAFLPLVALSQAKSHRVAILSTSADTASSFRNIVLPELARHGFVEGSNLFVAEHFGGADEMPKLAREALSTQPDVVIASSLVSVRAARDASSTIPIVMSYLGEDPVAQGLVESLARPGTNVTGLVLMAPELGAKRIALLREALPAARRLGIMAPRPPRSTDQVNAMKSAAERLSFEVRVFYVDEEHEYVEAFTQMRTAGIETLATTAHIEFARNREVLSRLATNAGIAMICHWATMVREGCLLGYGPHSVALRRRTADFIVRIFGGASARELPIEQPATFEVAVNLRTAKALGVSIPPTILVRADEVLE